MRRLMRLWVVFVVLAAVAAGAQVGGGRDGEDAPDLIQVTLLHMNDIYEIEPLGNRTVGGLAHVAALRKRLLKQNPHTCTLHAGDFLSPSAYLNAKVGGRRLAGRHMVAVLDSVGVDCL